MTIFKKFSKIFFFIPMIIPMLLLGHNTKKKYWPKSPQLKKPPKMPKNTNFGAYFDHFLSFWRPSLSGEFRGYSFVFWYVSLQNMKKHRFFSIGQHGTPCHKYKSNPLKRSANVRGVVNTQILPNICCHILHLCTSYSNKTGFKHCAVVKLKCHQFSTMVWPTLELSTGP